MLCFIRPKKSTRALLFDIVLPFRETDQSILFVAKFSTCKVFAKKLLLSELICLHIAKREKALSERQNVRIVVAVDDRMVLLCLEGGIQMRF